MARAPSFKSLQKFFTQTLGDTAEVAESRITGLKNIGMSTRDQEKEILGHLRSKYKAGMSGITHDDASAGEFIQRAMGTQEIGGSVYRAGEIDRAGRGTFARQAQDQEYANWWQNNLDTQTARQAAAEEFEQRRVNQLDFADKNVTIPESQYEALKNSGKAYPDTFVGQKTQYGSANVAEQSIRNSDEYQAAVAQRDAADAAYASSQQQAEAWRQQHEAINQRIKNYNRDLDAQVDPVASYYRRKENILTNNARVEEYNARKAEVAASIGDRATAAAEGTIKTETGEELLTNSVYQSKMREQYGKGYFSNNAVRDRLSEDARTLKDLERDYNSLSMGDDSLAKFNERYGTNVTHNNGAFSSLESAQSQYFNKRLETGPNMSNYLWGNRVPETAAGLAVAAGAVNIIMGDGRRSNAQLYSSPF